MCVVLLVFQYRVVRFGHRQPGGVVENRANPSEE
jgi:hypothetical protein